MPEASCMLGVGNETCWDECLREMTKRLLRLAGMRGSTVG